MKVRPSGITTFTSIVKELLFQSCPQSLLKRLQEINNDKRSWEKLKEPNKMCRFKTCRVVRRIQPF